MYLFSRTIRLGAGNPEKQLAWALKITEKVNQISETPVELWSSVFSPRAETLVWTATVDDLLTLETIDGKLISDSGYVSLVEEGAAHASGDPVDDGLLQFVFADPATAEVDATYATTVQATLAPGGIGARDGARCGDRAACRKDQRLPDLLLRLHDGGLRQRRVDQRLHVDRAARNAARRRSPPMPISRNWWTRSSARSTCPERSSWPGARSPDPPFAGGSTCVGLPAKDAVSRCGGTAPTLG